MKKIFLFVGLFLININFIISAQPFFKTQNDTYYLEFDYDHYNKIEKVSKGKILSLDNNFGCLFSDTLVVKDDKNNIKEISFSDIIPIDTKELFEDSIIKNTSSNSYWVPYYYYEILYNKKIDDLIYLYETHIKDVSNYSDNNLMAFKSDFYFYNYLVFTNSLIGIGYGNNYSPQHTYDLNILNIERDALGYVVTVTNGKSIINRFKKSEIETVVLKNSWLLSVLPHYTDYKSYKLYIRFDGDYLQIFVNSEENLLQTFCKMDSSTQEEFYALLKSGSCSENNIHFPHHADGTCDYDGSSKKVTTVNTSQSKTSETTKASSSTNVSVNKTMTTTCNLKLRSGEATSTQVLTVMSAGTKVKILELGKAETIDGINSNWVKVEVQSGAKDRDGKTIKAGLTGWCYGGYLE